MVACIKACLLEFGKKAIDGYLMSLHGFGLKLGKKLSHPLIFSQSVGIAVVPTIAGKGIRPIWRDLFMDQPNEALLTLR